MIILNLNDIVIDICMYLPNQCFLHNIFDYLIKYCVFVFFVTKKLHFM